MWAQVQGDTDYGGKAGPALAVAPDLLNPTELMLRVAAQKLEALGCVGVRVLPKERGSAGCKIVQASRPQLDLA